MQGQLFSHDFLTCGVVDTPLWQGAIGADFDAFVASLRSVFTGLGAQSTINEAQTESLVIYKVLAALGWGDDWLPQVNSDPKGRESVPDCLLFADSASKARAVAESKDDRRYRHGIAILEAKRWLRPLDRGDTSNAFDPDAPSSQMLRYLSRVDVASDRAVKWGLLTNGAVWRLYWQDARSRSQQFFEVNVAAALGLPGVVGAFDEGTPDHALRLFWLLFQRFAFLPQAWDSAGRSLHGYALNEARLYEEKVSSDLGARVFDEIFPQLSDALARGDLQAQSHSIGYGHFTRSQFTPEYLDEVREAALVLLYRLLFLFYAEDRNLLPVHDDRYAPYSVRRIREKVRDKTEARGTFSSTIPNIWLALRGVFGLINTGDDDIGMPAYNGGLFARSRAPLLERSNVPDKVMAPIIDALSRRTKGELRVWINYRDLSVSHLGSIYERLLEYSLVHEVQARDDYKDKPEINRIVAQPASFARKVSGSYYTHDDLVRLVLRESVGRLAAERVQRFSAHVAQLKKKRSLNPGDWDALDALDAAGAILELKVCDPAMGSGHFLVALVDDLADYVLEAMAAATTLVNAQPWAAHLVERGQPWLSPLVARIASIRSGIKSTAQAHGWRVTDEQLDDRHIVRRMILKKTIFGVDKNPMAVELAKTALWLHTFTVGAPLSFLDHHLRCGDSLHGERLSTVQLGLQQLGSLLLQSEFNRLDTAAKAIAQVADLTDADISEAHLSMELARQAAAQVAPIHAVLDFWRAMRWLLPGWPVDKAAKLTRLLPAGDERLAALVRLLNPNHNLVAVLSAGRLDGKTRADQVANELMASARVLAARESFFHWWTSFPTVFRTDGSGGFDAVIGNPPWDRIKLQEVEWFAERNRNIAAQPRAAQRKQLIEALREQNAPLWQSYVQAAERAKTNARVLGNGKQGSSDYPLLGGGDVNLYSLFVERAQSLIAADGLVALLAPSGIAADKGAAAFFRSISATGRLGSLFDFENRKVFFPDVHASFKFCALLFGGAQRRFAQTRCAFYLHSLADLDDPARALQLTADDFQRVNPNTAAAPIFRSRRDADITLALYARHPVLVRHGQLNTATGQQPNQQVWPLKYATMFHMTNDSNLFLTAKELRQQGFAPAALNRWRNAAGDEALPLYVGRMIHQYDHRHAGVTVNEKNLHNAAISASFSASDKVNPNRYPLPQYWVRKTDVPESFRRNWALGFRDIARATDMRTMIAAICPGVAAGNTLPFISGEHLSAADASLLLANFNSLALDYIARQKTQSTHLNWYILEQLPVIATARFNEPLPAAFVAAMRQDQIMKDQQTQPSVADFVVAQVLALSYTAHDLAPFARDLGYVDARGAVLPPFVWNDEERRLRLTALDAVFFWLYGLGSCDAGYVIDSFPIVREQDERSFGRWRSREDILALLPLLGVS